MPMEFQSLRRGDEYVRHKFRLTMFEVIIFLVFASIP